MALAVAVFLVVRLLLDVLFYVIPPCKQLCNMLCAIIQAIGCILSVITCSGPPEAPNTCFDKPGISRACLPLLYVGSIAVIILGGCAIASRGLAYGYEEDTMLLLGALMYWILALVWGCYRLCYMPPHDSGRFTLISLFADDPRAIGFTTYADRQQGLSFVRGPSLEQELSGEITRQTSWRANPRDDAENQREPSGENLQSASQASSAEVPPSNQTMKW